MKTILMATDKADGRDYLMAYPCLKPAIIVTPRSSSAARGWIGPVYATPSMRKHARFEELSAVTVLCALTLPEEDRIA
ncbi:hypothetical protein [Leucobacter salsicius]|uniref:hypothetical protein n=1 Tax=Leucobacter salsicius TaxID=664638 RepID=UPI00034D394F|nr:hypothetical protein [Leucobacter salsicius]